MKKILYLFLVAISTTNISIAQINSKTIKNPNVIFILADDLGINALNCYGNDLVESPNIDKLFESGMHFTNGYSNDPTCAPSRASIMTGQYVPRHKWYRVADRYRGKPSTLENMKFMPPANNKGKQGEKGVSPEKIMIPEALKLNGYATSAYGKWHMGRGNMGIPAQGFDEGFEMLGHYNFKTSPEQNIKDPKLYSSDLVASKTIDFMKKSVKEGTPFFSYVPFYLVHKPLEPKAEILKHFQEKLKDNPNLDADELMVLAMIKSLDENVGQILDAVKELGIEEETVIIFTSDNGHYRTNNDIFNHPYRGNKGQIFEGGIRIPYIFSWKNNIDKNSVSTEPIIHVDLYPTILELTNTNPPTTPLDGESIVPILTNKNITMQRDALVWEYTNYANYSVKKKTFASEWVNVIQMDGFKLTEVIETDSYFMYDLNNDPYETKEVSAEYPKIAEKLKNRLEKWKVEVEYEQPKLNPDYKNKI